MKPLTLGGVEFHPQFVLVIVITTILPMLDWYGHSPVRWVQETTGWSWLAELSNRDIKAYDRFLYYGVLPLLIIVVGWREWPSAYGFGFGHWREGLFWTAVGCAGMSVILWFLAQSGDMQSYYAARGNESAWKTVYITAVEMFGWEFIWRGFMLFALIPHIGLGPALWIQAIPFAFMHLNKPEIETLSTLFGGFAFGWVAWRTNSFVYPFLIHTYIASFTLLLAGKS